MWSLPQQASQSLAWRAIEAASRVGAAGRFWGARQHPCSASCTSSGTFTAPIEAAYNADSAYGVVESCGGPGAVADCRRPRPPLPPPLLPFACCHFCLADTMAGNEETIAGLRAENEELRAKIELLRQVKALLTEMERRQHLCLPHPCSHQVFT
jgi:hypothetical protein